MEDPLMLYADAKTTFNEWTFSDPTTNKKGGRSVFIFRSPNSTNAPAVQLTKDNDPRLRTPFGVSKYDESSASTRMNLDFNIDCKELEEFFNELDAFLPTVAHQQCQNWFKKSLSQTEINSMYKPLLTTSEKYPPMIRTKINTAAGKNSVRVWKVVGQREGKIVHAEGSIEDIQKGATFWATVTISGMYFLARLFGCTLTTTDLLVFPQQRQAIPFVTQIALEKGEDDDENEHDEETPQEKESARPPVLSAA